LGRFRSPDWSAITVGWNPDTLERIESAIRITLALK
jgi:hypothetical protein